MTENKYDIAIVGGGIAGLSLACALAQQTSLSVAVLEAKPVTDSWDASHYHHRVSAISLSSMRIFQHLGVWDALCSHRVSPFERIEVWESNRDSKIQFDSGEIAEPVLGYIIENNLIQQCLYQRLTSFPQVQVIAPVQLQSFATHDNEVVLTTADNLQIHAKLVVGADGANSWVRKEAGITMSVADYGHDAIVATVQTALPHQRIARQVFLPNGPLAFLPLKEANTSSFVWSMPPEEVQRYMAMSDDAFKQAAELAFNSQLGAVTALDQRYCFPLKKQRAANYIAHRVALMSDAAHTMHPLAGQGINLGLLDAASLAEVITEAYQQGRDPFSRIVLRRYERWRKAENNMMLQGVDIMKNVFVTSSKPAQSLRSLGFYLTETLPFLRAFFTRYAVGNRAGLPKLAQPQLA